MSRVALHCFLTGAFLAVSTFSSFAGSGGNFTDGNSNYVCAYTEVEDPAEIVSASPTQMVAAVPVDYQAAELAKGSNYVDENGDGVCDNYENRSDQNGDGVCNNYENRIDQDGDGVCDNYENRECPRDGTGNQYRGRQGKRR